jgi:hypothetical protein
MAIFSQTQLVTLKRNLGSLSVSYFSAVASPIIITYVTFPTLRNEDVLESNLSAFYKRGLT